MSHHTIPTIDTFVEQLVNWVRSTGYALVVEQIDRHDRSYFRVRVHLAQDSWTSQSMTYEMGIIETPQSAAKWIIETLLSSDAKDAPMPMPQPVSVWKETHVAGVEKWFAIHPDTGALITNIDPDQVYFWTEAWQAGEREVDEDIAAGRVTLYKNVEDFLADLDGESDGESDGEHKRS